jgi:hypothetical protein
VEARAEQDDLLEESLDEVARALGGEVLAGSRYDECYQGQRNSKVDTGYGYRCTLLMGRLVGFDGDFRAQMLDLDARLAAIGWESTDGNWPGQLVDDYWDMRAAESKTGLPRLDRLPGPWGVYRDDVRIMFDYGSPSDERGLERIDRAQQRSVWCCGAPFYTDSDLVDIVDVGSSASDHLILITVEGHYWEQ